ncbi:MAG: bifunctional aspartate kinase/diaminopimelate decarboxylase [Robiginitomaculum sp.]|nr:bifunctional aspartate kinase/diaminopimelate decarboxylase [Robiginitomaculum sp.]
METTQRPWIVMKFGGTSVASVNRWQSIVKIIAACTAEGNQVLIVHSALSGVSNLLETAIKETAFGEHQKTFEQICKTHVELCTAMNIDHQQLLDSDFHKLQKLLSGMELTGEASPMVQAKTMAIGEIMATKIGAQYLLQNQIQCKWLDARELLLATTSKKDTDHDRFLSANCDDTIDKNLQQKLLQTKSAVILTQGFIASNKNNETVLLGRGGSDVSAALFAAKIAAKRLEIWTDVPGMFSADPKYIASARLLKDLSYREAQEIASLGAKVVHPRSFPPVRRASIPVHVRCTHAPHLAGTKISDMPADSSPRVKAITVRSGITLISLTTSSMWKVPGFLAMAFSAFMANNLSIDLVTTSETSVTVSLDANQSNEDEALEQLTQDLSSLCKIEIVKGCNTVSLVGRGIRTILHKLTPTLELFTEHPIRLLSLAANDLNLTVIVDAEQAQLLAARLHDVLFDIEENDLVFGPTWDEKTPTKNEQLKQTEWWQEKRQNLLELMADRNSAYVYDLETIDQALQRLQNLRSIDKCFYAMKANAHPKVLQRVIASGTGIECVSIGEMKHVLQHFPDIDRQKLLFTPNFAARTEFEFAFSQNIKVTLDAIYPIKNWPELFDGARLNLRVDPMRSRGHHKHVLTAGDRAKFGIPATDIPQISDLVKKADAIVDGLHSHAGSGILDPDHWSDIGSYLAGLKEYFPGLTHINLGGGLGVPERPGGTALDMATLDAGLLELKKHLKNIGLWLEPGRYVVAEAGVLLSRVTQTKSKYQSRFIGIDTGMNSLLRPALYSSRHEIFNLTRLEQSNDTRRVTIVGPICESADIIGTDRQLPKTSEGDILLIANAGAYGAVMSSNYNLREPAAELTI